MVNGNLTLVVLAPIAVGLIVHLVWMGLALGAVLTKLGAPAFQAWIPVLRWIAAARVGRTSVLTVAIARSVGAFGALVTFVAALVLLLTDVNTLAESGSAGLIALLVGAFLWILGSLTGWVLWIYGAGTIQMRMRAPRGLTWVAALWPVVWASILGWGKYVAIGGGIASTGAIPQVVAAAPASPAPSAATPPDLDSVAHTRVSPFASLAPKDGPPAPSAARAPESAAAPMPPSTPAAAPPTFAQPMATSPAPTPPAPTPPAPTPPTAAPSDSPSDTPPASDVSQYMSQLSPYLAPPPSSEPRPQTPPAHSAPASNPERPSGPPPQPAPQASPSSWIDRMHQASAAEAEPQPDKPSEPAKPPVAPAVPAPPAPNQQPAPIQQPAPSQQSAPAEAAQAPTQPTPTPPQPPAEQPDLSSGQPSPSGEATPASAVVPVISPPPAQTPPAAPIPTPPAAAGNQDDEDDDHTIVVRRASHSWVLQIDNASYSLSSDSVVLGRATAAIRPGILGVADTTRTMSKRHAELIRRDDGWWVRDLGSTNGTYVRSADGSERRIEGTDSEIVDGDLILGDLVTRIVRNGDS